MKRILVHGFTAAKDSPTLLIYGLIDPRTRLIRYIGKSSSGTARPKQHATERADAESTTYCRRWIRSLQKLGLIFQIVILEVLDDVTKLDETECWWIAFGRALKWPLTNHQEGGVPTAETLAKIAERQKQKIERAAEKQRDAEERQRLKREFEEDEAARIRTLRSMIYSPAELAAIEARKNQRRRTPAEIERCCFELFEKHQGSRRMFIDVVIGAKVTPDTARWLYEIWLTSSSRTPSRVAMDHEDLRTRLARERLGERFV